jgi:hypothetical protein
LGSDARNITATGLSYRIGIPSGIPTLIMCLAGRG